MFVGLISVLGLFATFISCETGLEDNVSNRDIPYRGIGFEAHMVENKRPFYPLGRRLVFPVCKLNEGNGYDPNSGVFRAPIPGVYAFHVHVCNSPGKHMVFGLRKGYEKIAVSVTYDQKGGVCGSLSTLVRLARGEPVVVVALWSSQMWVNGERWSSFSGYRVF